MGNRTQETGHSRAYAFIYTRTREKTNCDSSPWGGNKKQSEKDQPWGGGGLK